MSYFCSFPPKFTFPRCSEEFLFPSTKIQNIYHIDNQLVALLRLFRDYPYFKDGNVIVELDANEGYKRQLTVHILDSVSDGGSSQIDVCQEGKEYGE